MATYPLIQVDAFTDRPLCGNPCVVLFDTEDLTDDDMLLIAREMNLSETAFIRKTANGNFAARYFTPAEEIPFAGHPTIASVCALIDSQRIFLAGDYSTIMLEVQTPVTSGFPQIPPKIHSQDRQQEEWQLIYGATD